MNEVRIDIDSDVPGAAGAALAANLRNRADVFSKEEIRAMRSPSLKTAAYTAIAGDFILADTTGGPWPLTLPAAPSAGAAVRVIGHGWDLNNLTIARNGQTIDGTAENLTCDYDTDLLMVFIDGSWTY
jgi:hypothetical protein